MRHLLVGHIENWYHFLIKWLSKSKILCFITKMNTSKETETNSDILSCDVFSSDVIYFFIKNIKVFQWVSKSKFLCFMTKVNSQNGNETNLISIFNGCKILKYFYGVS